MNKTIKVIDLLNKIANGENLPDKIKFDGEIFDLLRFGPIRYTTDNLDLLEDCILEKTDLLEEVEIIEEEPEIDIQGIEEIKTIYNPIYGIGMMRDKINELIRAVKQLDKQINGDKQSIKRR